MTRKRGAGRHASPAELDRSKKKVLHASATQEKAPAGLSSRRALGLLRSENEIWGLALVVIAVAFSAIYAAPEMRIGRVPLDDVVFHLAASERMETSFERGEPFLDPWVSEWALGYPLWRSYQPAGHVVAAAAIHIFRPVADPASTFAVLFYLLIAALPVSIYTGARLFGLSPPASGLAALLVWAASANGDPGRYGISYGSVLWRGSGLYTQLFALHFLVLSLGLVASALDNGGLKRRASAALVLALTSLTHIIFGYAAFVSAALLAVIGPRSRRSERLVRLVTIVLPALALMSWFLIPLFQSTQIVNHNRWEATTKWDSYGAPFILRELLSGRLLDFARLPVLSILVATGAVVAALCYRDDRAKRLLALCGLWLALFFGRETWGRLVVFAGVPADLHMHRLEAVFELSAVLLTAFGLTRLVELATKRSRILGLLGGAVVAAAVVYMGVDRVGYLHQNATWGTQNLTNYQAERGDLEAAFSDARSILAVRPGRVSAGMPSNWGHDFKIGSVPVWAFLSRDHFDQPSFLYHAMSKTSDIMVLRDENNRGHDVVFGIRLLVAPANLPMPAYMQRRSVQGRFAVYETSPEGYFGVVDLVAHYVGPPSTDYEPNAAWLKSNLMSWGLVVSLDPKVAVGPAIQRWEALPDPTAEQEELRGRVLSESKVGETYQARIEVNRPSYAFVKITWSPDLVATVDGEPARVVHVTPGFGAVPIGAGQHDVVVQYHPGATKSLLFLASICAFALGCVAFGASKLTEIEGAVAARLTAAGQRFATRRAAVAGALLLASIIALHPLFRGKLVMGHDSTAYPPRLVEFAKVLSWRQLPPIWAPDLGAGHGQPLFEFAPPLVYAAAVPLYYAGCGLSDSYQLGLAFLHILGAIAVYRIGRRLKASRFAAFGGAVAWLFAPYLALDLFVRGAFAEAAGVAVAPIALLGVWETMERPTAGRIALGAIAVALIPLAHNVAALMLIPALAGFVVIRAYVAYRSETAPPAPRLARLAPFVSGVVTIGAGLALSAYFWIPALLEKTYTHTDRLRQGATLWSDHFVYPLQLLWSAWGYGMSVPGPNDGMSFALGPVHLALAIAGLVFAVRSANRRRKFCAIFFALAAAAGAWLSTYWAAPVYRRVETLQYLVQPWRTLILPGLFLSLLVIFAFERLGPRWTGVCLLALVLFNLPHTEAQGFFTFDDEFYTPQSMAMKSMNTSTFEEYEPRWVKMRPPYYGQPLVGLSDRITLSNASQKAARQEFIIQTPVAARVETSTFYYPGQKITVDGTPVQFSIVPVRGTMEFELPAGTHQVAIELRRTPARRVALFLSFLSAFLIAAAIATDRWRRAISPPNGRGAHREATTDRREIALSPDAATPAAGFHGIRTKA